MKQRLIESSKSGSYSPSVKTRTFPIVIYAHRDYTEWRQPNGSVTVEHHRQKISTPDEETYYE